MTISGDRKAVFPFVSGESEIRLEVSIALLGKNPKGFI